MIGEKQATRVKVEVVYPWFVGILLFISATGVGAIVLWGGITAFKLNSEITRDCYMISTLKDVLVVYSKDSRKNWPSSWNDLVGSFEIVNARRGNAWTFYGLRDSTWIDFQFKPDGDRDYRQAFGLKSNRDVYWEGEDPWGEVKKAFTQLPEGNDKANSDGLDFCP